MRSGFALRSVPARFATYSKGTPSLFCSSYTKVTRNLGNALQFYGGLTFLSTYMVSSLSLIVFAESWLQFAERIILYITICYKLQLHLFLLPSSNSLFLSDIFTCVELFNPLNVKHSVRFEYKWRSIFIILCLT